MRGFSLQTTKPASKLYIKLYHRDWEQIKVRGCSVRKFPVCCDGDGQFSFTERFSRVKSVKKAQCRLMN